jgi:hypothetical protein
MSAKRNVFGRGPEFGQSLLETLEARMLLAGNVVAVQSGDQLNLFGDALGNEIKVWSGGRPGELFVQGENNTRVNGTEDQWVFEGVNQIAANFREGSDSFKATNLTFSTTLFGRLLVDMGAGDDRVEVKNTTIHSTQAFGSNAGIVTIIGESASGGTPSTGNDIIDVADTTIIAVGGSSSQAELQIYGEEVNGGQVTGGNDRISVTNTVISATDGVFQDSVFVLIYGDLLFGGTVGGGNDTISVANTTVSATGGAFQNFAFVDVYGDRSSGAGTTVGGGNDSISVDNLDVTAANSPSFDLAFVRLTGDFSVGGQIGGGRDRIGLSNARIAVTGGTSSDDASVQLFGEQTSGVPGTAIGEGDDIVRMGDVRVEGSFSEVFVDTGIGDDFLEVANSSFGRFDALLGMGNDEAKFTNNNFVSAHLDGGLLEFDRLIAQNNRGFLSHSNFEEFYVTP